MTDTAIDVRPFRLDLGIALRRYWRSVTAIFVVIAAGTFLFAITLPDRYTATALVVYAPNRGASNLVTGGRPEAPAAIEAAAIKTELDLITSPSLLSQVAAGIASRKDLDLEGASRQSPLGKALDDAKQAIKGVGATPKRADLMDRHPLTDFVEAGLSVSNDGRSHTIRISFTSTDPRASAAVANAVAKAYIDRQAEARRHELDGVIEWMDGRLGQLKQQLLTSQQELLDYRRANRLDVLHGETQVGQQVGALNAALAQAQADRQNAEARLAAARQVLNTGRAISGSLPGIETPLLVSLRDRQATLLQEQARLSEGLGPRHPEVERVDRQLTDVNQRVQVEERSIVAGLSSQVAVAQQRENSVIQQLARIQAAQAASTGSEAKLVALAQEAESNKAMYDALLERSKQMHDRLQLATADSALLSAAQSPPYSDLPPKSTLAAVAIVVSFLVALASAVLRHQFDRTVRTIDDVRHRVGLQVIAVLPRSGRDALTRGGARAERSRPLDAFAAGLRNARSAVELARSKGQRVLLVTSAVSSEGKTTLCAGLARELGQSGLRVLVVDFDLYRPNLHRTMLPSTEQTTGSGVAAGLDGMGLPAIVREETPGGNVHLLPGEPVGSDEIGRLSVDRVSRLIANARGSYDIVLIDAPPVFASNDVAILARCCDASLLVVRWGHTSLQLVADAADFVRRHCIDVLGVVLNQVRLGECSAHELYFDYRPKRSDPAWKIS